MKEGKVKFFNENKGFGFIKDAESGNEYFVHVSGLVDKIKEDDNVSFELQQGKKGLNAVCRTFCPSHFRYQPQSWPGQFPMMDRRSV